MWVYLDFALGSPARAELVGPVFPHEANASAGRPTPGTSEGLAYSNAILHEYYHIHGLRASRVAIKIAVWSILARFTIQGPRRCSRKSFLDHDLRAGLAVQGVDIN